MDIGIEKLGVYPCALSLDIADLCAARGLDAGNFRGRLFCDERSVMGPFEDVITLAVNAAKPLLTDADRDAIRLLIVATESAPDQEKPGPTALYDWLNRAAAEKRVRREGSGTRTDPWRYRLANEDDKYYDRGELPPLKPLLRPRGDGD